MMRKKKRRHPAVVDTIEETSHHLIVTDVVLRTVLLDDFTNPIYSDWKAKTHSEQMEILESRKPNNFFNVHKIEEDLYRLMYKLSPEEPIVIGTVHKLRVSKEKKRKDNFVECIRSSDIVIQ